MYIRIYDDWFKYMEHFFPSGASPICKVLVKVCSITSLIFYLVESDLNNAASSFLSGDRVMYIIDNFVYDESFQNEATHSKIWIRADHCQEIGPTLDNESYLFLLKEV